jgi:hypothetical protein
MTFSHGSGNAHAHGDIDERGVGLLRLSLEWWRLMMMMMMLMMRRRRRRGRERRTARWKTCSIERR